MKKILLTGSLATLLLLAACGTTEEDTSTEEPAEETDTSTAAEPAGEEAESTESSDEEIEQAEAEGKDEVAESVDEEIETENGNVETIKEVEIGETVQLENVNMTVNIAQINKLTADENLSIFLDGVEPGDKVENLVIEYTVENTTDAPRNFYIDQAEVVTSTGQQLMPELLLANGITGSMQGAVNTTGTVPYMLEPGTAEDIEWVDVIVPNVSDGATYEALSEGQKYRIEF